MGLPVPPPGRRAAEYTGLSGYNFLAMVRRGFFYTFLMVFLRERLGLPVTAVALIGAVNAVSSTLGQVLLWGRLSDRTDRRAGLMVLGEAIAGLGYLGTGFVFRLCLDHLSPAGVITVLVLCLGTLEFFWSMTDVGFRAAIAQVTTTENRGRFLGAIELTGLVGMGAGLFLAGHLYRDGEGFTKGWLWYLAAGFILAGVPLIRLTLSHIDKVSVARTGRADTGGRLSPDFRRYVVTLTVAVLGLWCFQQNHNYFVRLPDTAAAGDRELSLIRMAFWVAGGATAPLWGWLLDRFGARRGYPASLLLCSLLPLTFLATRSVPFAVVSLGLFGALLTAFRTASYALAAELTPADSRGRHFAVYNAVMSAGWGIAAVAIGGPVADLLIGSGAAPRVGYGATFVVGAALGLSGLLLFLLLLRPSRPERP